MDLQFRDPLKQPLTAKARGSAPKESCGTITVAPTSPGTPDSGDGGLSGFDTTLLLAGGGVVFLLLLVALVVR